MDYFTPLLAQARQEVMTLPTDVGNPRVTLRGIAACEWMMPAWLKG
jgi:hypothetical protein